ncbi:MAG: hypothetical protein ABTQ32_19235 [Myxococcaceae bacterium]
MSFIDKLRGAVSTVGAQAKQAAKDTARELQLPPLMIEKGAQLAKIDKEIAGIGWSANPEAKARKAQLGQQRAQVKGELESLKAEAKQFQDKAREANRQRMNMLR